MRRVIQESQLLKDCLLDLLPESSGRTRKQFLEMGRVRLNGTVARIGTTPLAPGDVIELGDAVLRGAPLRRLQIVHEDDDVVVIEKASGLLTIATERERQETAYRQVSTHLKLADPGAHIFIVHRLDRLASGLLVFAKNTTAQRALQGQLRVHSMERTYLALCCGLPKAMAGTIEKPLIMGRTGNVHVRDARSQPTDAPPKSNSKRTDSKRTDSKRTDSKRTDSRPPRADATSKRADAAEDDQGGSRERWARTHYRVLAAGHRFSLLEVKLETGRKHQIRVHLTGIGHPICGDVRYGGGDVDPAGRLALHATTLAFDHPRSGKRLRFESPAPWKVRLGRPEPVAATWEPETKESATPADGTAQPSAGSERGPRRDDRPRPRPPKDDRTGKRRAAPTARAGARPTQGKKRRSAGRPKPPTKKRR